MQPLGALKSRYLAVPGETPDGKFTSRKRGGVMNAHSLDNRLATEIMAEEETLREMRNVFQTMTPRALRVMAQNMIVNRQFTFKLAKAAAAELVFRAIAQQNQESVHEMTLLTAAEKKELYDGALG
jgi:hypothetical protein